MRCSSYTDDMRGVFDGSCTVETVDDDADVEYVYLSVMCNDL